MSFAAENAFYQHCITNYSSALTFKVLLAGFHVFLMYPTLKVSKMLDTLKSLCLFFKYPCPCYIRLYLFYLTRIYDVLSIINILQLTCPSLLDPNL